MTCLSRARAPRALPRRFAAAVFGGSLLLAACGTPNNPTSGTHTADTVAAEATVAKYSGAPTAFPVDTRLARSFASDSTFVFLQCASPVCAIFADLLTGAGKAMGIDLKIVKAGFAVNEQQSAMDSIRAMKPAGVIIAGLDPAAIGPQLKELTRAGVAVASMGLVDTDAYGVQAAIASNAAVKLVGAALADWVVAEHGGKSRSVIYSVPELSFSRVLAKAFSARMKELCPKCPTRTVDVGITEIGTTAPATMISDLQRNGATNVAVFSTMEMAQGLPAALRTAGIGVDTIGFAPTPNNLQDIKDGGMTAALALDLPVQTWMTLDAVARIASSQELTELEQSGLAPIQFLTRDDITFDPSHGFSAYPDFVERFASVWSEK